MEKSTVRYALVVDDDPLILMDASDILAAAGSRVREAGTGDEAKAFLETDGASVILLFSDVEMPGTPTASRWHAMSTSIGRPSRS